MYTFGSGTIHNRNMTLEGRSPPYGLMMDAVSGNPLVKMLEPIIEPGPKQGHLFFGCCCDMRSATIVINTIVLTLNLLFMISFYFLLDFLFSDVMTNAIEDDELKHEMEAIDLPATFTVLLIILLGPGCLCSLAAIVGAMRYKAWLVIVNIIYLTAIFILPVIISIQEDSADFAIKILLVYCFFMYPHVMLVYELKGSKTMSRQTYHREEQSCC